MPNNGPRMIEGETSRICGLAICVGCKLEKMGEAEVRTLCPIHCDDLTMSSHPLLNSASPSPPEDNEANASTVTPTSDEDKSDDEDILHREVKTFIPDYERISYAYAAVDKIFKGNDDDDGFVCW